MTETATVTQIGPPVDPPAEWFQDPGLTEATPLDVTPDGRVTGHIATWDTCHVGLGPECVQPPRGTGYSVFASKPLITAEGERVWVGRITMDTRHADKSFTAAATLSHYEDTGVAAADVAVGDDSVGIWVAGAMRPGSDPARMRALRASPVSGDWREFRGGLELMAVLAVNVAGFPVPRPQQLVASAAGEERVVTLIAAGMLDPDDDAVRITESELAWLRASAGEARVRREYRANRVHAAALLRRARGM